MQNKIIKYLLPEEQDANVISIFTKSYVDWVEKTLTESKNSLLKESNTLNLADSAVLSESTHTINVNGFVLQVHGAVQAVFSAADTSWYIFPAFNFAANRTSSTMGYQLQFETGANDLVFAGTGEYEGSASINTVLPATSTISQSITQGSTHGFSVGASINDIGIVTASFTYSCSYSNSHTWAINPCQVTNSTSILMAYTEMNWQWNSLDSYVDEYPVNLYYVIPYNEASVGHGNMGGGWFSAMNAAGDNMYPQLGLSVFDFYLPSKGTLLD